MAAYVIYQAEVTDPGQYERYRERSMRACYDGEAYREARSLREGAVVADLYIVDGVD